MKRKRNAMAIIVWATGMLLGSAAYAQGATTTARPNPSRLQVRAMTRIAASLTRTI